jgi:NAD(P)H-dependent FMN reductase
MKVQIIIGSVRPGRISDKVGKWVANEAKQLPDTTVETIDLIDYVLPFLDEPISPQFNPDRKPNPVASKLLSKLAEADAYVIVTPEYNRSYSAVLKNAIDYIDFQLAKKPVSLVAHGVNGGAQALDHLRSVIPALKAFTIPTGVYFSGGAGQLIDDEGNLSKEVQDNPRGPQVALKNALTELKWYSDIMVTARATS